MSATSLSPFSSPPPKKNALLLNADEILWLIADIHKKEIKRHRLRNTFFQTTCHL